MQVNVGEIYIFTKSGNEVRAIAPTGACRGLPMWEVERTQGASASKRMDVPARALAKNIDWPEKGVPAMWKPGDWHHSMLRRAEADGYPAIDFESWYQQGMACYQAALPQHLRKQAMRALASRWIAAGNQVETWHLRAFVYGTLGLDAHGRRHRLVPDGYEWPTPPDAAWKLMVCCYPDGEIDLDFGHPVSRRFWSEDNGFLTLPEERTTRFDRLWYERMGFEVMVMTPYAHLGVAKAGSHLRVAQNNG